MICPDCGKTGLQVSGMQAGLEGAYDFTNLITRVDITCHRCKATFDTKSVTTLGLRRVKRGTTTRTGNSSIQSSVKAAASSGINLPIPTDQTPSSNRYVAHHPV